MAINIAGGTERLRPHAKTHKMAEVTAMLIDAGISKFKCATIAEAEMLASAGAHDILLAYQPTSVKAQRLRGLAAAYPSVIFGYLVDSRESAESVFTTLNAPNLHCWIDVNVGMNRTGIMPANVAELYDFLRTKLEIEPVGLHAYDGHLHIREVNTRFAQAQTILDDVRVLRRTIEKQHHCKLAVVIGGTPAFPFYASQQDVDASPGTFVFWDAGYASMFPDMQFHIAAVLITRVISIVSRNLICLDLGHKSVAAEGPLPRIQFPDHPNAKVVSQSEEHMVVEVTDSANVRIGDVWVGVPNHICPTIALYESVAVVENEVITERWKVISRDRMINY
jgi:D-threonine aldolase